MNWTDKLRHWGAAQAQVRTLERAAAQQTGGARARLEVEARLLRAQADKLHGEIYREIGGSAARPGG